jgi:hypothetical protein
VRLELRIGQLFLSVMERLKDRLRLGLERPPNERSGDTPILEHSATWPVINAMSDKCPEMANGVFSDNG